MTTFTFRCKLKKLFLYSFNLKSLALLIIVGLLASCNDKNDNGNNTSSASIDAGQCILSYRDHYVDLLTQERIAKFYDADFSSAKVDSSTFSNAEYWSFSYSWKGDKDRSRRLKAGRIDMPMRYRIGISRMKEYDEKIKDPVEYFTGMYRNYTAEEKKKAQEAIEKQLEKSDADDKTKKKAKSLSKVFTSGSNSLKFKQIDGVGDAASWDYMDNALKVLVGRVQFQIGLDLSDDIEKNQELAKKLAQDIIADCQ